MSKPMRNVEVLRAACCVAGLDGEVTPGERTALDRIAQWAGVGLVSLEAMIDRAKRDREFYKEQFKVLSAEPEQTIRMLIEVARADGTDDTDERVVIGYFAEKLGMSQADCARLWDEPAKPA